MNNRPDLNHRYYAIEALHDSQKQNQNRDRDRNHEQTSNRLADVSVRATNNNHITVGDHHHHHHHHQQQQQQQQQNHPNHNTMARQRHPATGNHQSSSQSEPSNGGAGDDDKNNKSIINYHHQHHQKKSTPKADPNSLKILGGAGGSKSILLDSCNRIKEEFELLQSQRQTLTMELDRIMSDKLELERHYLFYRNMSYDLNIESCKQSEINRRLLGIICQMNHYLGPNQQQQVSMMVEQARNVTTADIGNIMSAQIHHHQHQQHQPGSSMAPPGPLNPQRGLLYNGPPPQAPPLPPVPMLASMPYLGAHPMARLGGLHPLAPPFVGGQRGYVSTNHHIRHPGLSGGVPDLELAIGGCPFPNTAPPPPTAAAAVCVSTPAPPYHDGHHYYSQNVPSSTSSTRAHQQHHHQHHHNRHQHHQHHQNITNVNRLEQQSSRGAPTTPTLAPAPAATTTTATIATPTTTTPTITTTTTTPTPTTAKQAARSSGSYDHHHQRPLESHHRHLSSTSTSTSIISQSTSSISQSMSRPECAPIHVHKKARIQEDASESAGTADKVSTMASHSQKILILSALAQQHQQQQEPQPQPKPQQQQKQHQHQHQHQLEPQQQQDLVGAPNERHLSPISPVAGNDGDDDDLRDKLIVDENAKSLNSSLESQHATPERKHHQQQQKASMGSPIRVESVSPTKLVARDYDKTVPPLPSPSSSPPPEPLPTIAETNFSNAHRLYTSLAGAPMAPPVWPSSSSMGPTSRSASNQKLLDISFKATARDARQHTNQQQQHQAGQQQHQGKTLGQVGAGFGLTPSSTGPSINQLYHDRG